MAKKKPEGRSLKERAQDDLVMSVSGHSEAVGPFGDEDNGNDSGDGGKTLTPGFPRRQTAAASSPREA